MQFASKERQELIGAASGEDRICFRWRSLPLADVSAFLPAGAGLNSINNLMRIEDFF
jgi:hypothetical protein